MKQFYLLGCLLLVLAVSASADQLLYVINNTDGSMNCRIADVTSWSNTSSMKSIGTLNALTAGAYKAIYWDPTLGSTPRKVLGATGYNNTIAQAISSDGSVIVGVSATGTASASQQAVRFWSDGTTPATRLDALTGTTASVIGGISGDGTKAVGYRTVGTTVTATTWTIGTPGATSLTGKTRAYNTDDDAAFIIGRNLAAPGGWVLTGGGTTYTLPNAGTNYAGLQDPRAITSDGVYVAGVQASSVAGGTENKGVIWKWNGSAYVVDTILPSMTGYTGDLRWVLGGNLNQVTDLAGKYLVGYVKHANATTTPFIYERATNILHNINTFLHANALARIPSGFVISDIFGISNDGTAICGTIYNSTTSEGRGFVAKIPEPATIALLGLGGLALIRRKK